MKTATILLVILTVGLLVAGCSKTAPTTQAGPNIPAADTVTDITIDDTTANPDIGTLDDTPVSDELPQ